MKREQAGFEDARRVDPDGESEHEKRRRIKELQDRLLRKRLSRFRPAELDESEAAAARLRRLGE